jgi:hypothetical protein
MPWNRVLAAGGVAGLAALAGRYAAGLARADRSCPAGNLRELFPEPEYGND